MWYLIVSIPDLCNLTYFYFARATRVCSLSITTPVSLLANEFDVRSVLHGQVSYAAVNQICVGHEAMNGCKLSKDSLKDCLENVNIRF